MSRRLLGLLFAVAMTCANRYAVEQDFHSKCFGVIRTAFSHYGN